MPAFTDWVGMVEGRASMFLASPRVAEKVTGERTTPGESESGQHAGSSECSVGKARVYRARVGLGC
jgi:acetyl-CoA carboxylase carboxyltransferase component